MPVLVRRGELECEINMCRTCNAISLKILGNSGRQWWYLCHTSLCFNISECIHIPVTQGFRRFIKKFGFVFSGGLDPAADSKDSSETLCPERPQLHLFQRPQVVKHVVYCKYIIHNKQGPDDVFLWLLLL